MEVIVETIVGDGFSNSKLLSSKSTNTSSGCCSGAFPAGFHKEFKAILHSAWPLILCQFFQFFTGPMAVIFCGHLGKVELDAVALANSLINILGISIATGLTSASDTLFSQTYGSVNRSKLGIAVQRSLIILGLGALPCVAIYLNTGPLLILLGQEPEVVNLTASYMIIMIPGVMAFFIYITLTRYIQNMNIMYPVLIIGFLCNVVNAVLHYIFLYVLNMNTNGSAVAQSTSYFCMMLLTMGYIGLSGVYRDTWQGWHIDCLQDWGLFIRIALFGTVMLCMEWWSFEVGVFLSGVLGETELGAQSVLFQLGAVVYTLPQGMGIAASIRVGHYLGAGDPLGAKTAARVSQIIIAVIAVAVGILTIALSAYLPQIFTNVPEVVEMAAIVTPILGIYMIPSYVAGLSSGILRGSGRQMFGSIVVSIMYTCTLSIGIPLMMLTPLKLSGMWASLALGLTVQAIIYVVVINKTNWEKQVEKTQERIRTNQTILAGKKPHTGEETALLESGKSSRKHSRIENTVDSGSTDPLLRESQIKQRRFSSQVSEPYPPVIPPSKPLPRGRLIIRRITVVTIVFLVLIVGIIGHFLIGFDDGTNVAENDELYDHTRKYDEILQQWQT